MTELVQIGGDRKDKQSNHSHKKSILGKIKREFKEEWEITGGLSAPTKMPGYGYSTPASACITGAKLREVEGSACFTCYAFRGNYPYPVVQTALTKRLHGLNHPLWVPAMAKLINEACANMTEPYFRWHDSGDLQGIWHLDLIVQVCELTPNVKHWLPTREYKMLNDYNKKLPDNLVVRASAHMIDGKAPQDSFFNTSTITTNNNPVMDCSNVCQSYTREGFCGDCRKCWSKDVRDVSYPKH